MNYLHTTKDVQNLTPTKMKLKHATKLVIAVLIMLCIKISAFSNEWAFIYVSDPQEGWWNGGPGSIDEAIITIHPQGVYTEIGLYLEFSAKGLYFTNDDTVEVVMDFSLPEGSIVHDSWLWVGDSIVKADIIDRWTATTIYEEIVGRRQDPSILYKDWSNNYQLRIFPMAGDESRKVKLSYLVPNTWNINSVLAKLPVEILQASNYAIENIEIKVLENSQWNSPTLEPAIDENFVMETNIFYNTNKTVSMDHEDLGSSLLVAFSSPIENGVYVSTYTVDNENYYNMVFIPSLMTEIPSNPKRTLFLIDYDASKTNMTKDDIYDALMYILESNINPNDQFCVGFSGTQTTFITDDWINLTQINIDNYLKGVENPVNTYSNLPSLLSDGVEFILDNGNEGEIFLISDNDNIGASDVANGLMDDLLDMMDNHIFPVHVVNFISENYSYYFYNGNYYRGSEYFFINFSKQTGGNFYNYFPWEHDFTILVEEAYLSIGNFLSSVDLHTYTETGFCHSRYNLHNNLEFNLNKPVIQVGKFVGEVPFHILFSGVNNGIPFNKHVEIAANEIHAGDTLLEESWVGNYIADLERRNYSNETILEIIDYSISERVLSLYTAFLAIDPALMPDISGDENDGGWTEIDEISAEKVKDTFTAFPNPFRENLSIKFTVAESDDSDFILLKIYNITGQLVWMKLIKNDKDTYEVQWDGKDSKGNNLTEGTYLIVIESDAMQKTMKVVKH